MTIAPHALDERTVVLAVDGEITGSSGRELVVAAASFLRVEGPRVIIDLTGASFMDSGGVAALIGVWDETRSSGGQFVVVLPESSPARRTLEIRGIAGLFPVCGDRSAAVDALD